MRRTTVAGSPGTRAAPTRSSYSLPSVSSFTEPNQKKGEGRREKRRPSYRRSASKLRERRCRVVDRLEEADELLSLGAGSEERRASHVRLVVEKLVERDGRAVVEVGAEGEDAAQRGGVEAELS